MLMRQWDNIDVTLGRRVVFAGLRVGAGPSSMVVTWCRVQNVYIQLFGHVLLFFFTKKDPF